MNSQQEKLDNGDGADKVDQFALIFDDVIGDTKFMNTKAFTRCFYQVRHVNCTTFICTQHFKSVPKVCRLQANFIFFFEGSAAEVEMVTEEFSPPMYSKKEFKTLVVEATHEPYQFLVINMKVNWDKRFRRNLHEFIELDRMGGNEKDVASKSKKHKKDESNARTASGTDRGRADDASAGSHTREWFRQKVAQNGLRRGNRFRVQDGV